MKTSGWFTGLVMAAISLPIVGVATGGTGSGGSPALVWTLRGSNLPVAFSQDGSLAATLSSGLEVHIRETTNGTTRIRFHIAENPVCLAFDPAGRILVSAHHSPWEKDRLDKSILNLSSVKDGTLQQTLEVPVEIPSRLAGGFVFPPGARVSPLIKEVSFSRDGSWLAAASEDGVYLWQMPSGELKRFVPVRHCATFAFSPDGRLLGVGTAGNRGFDDAGVSVFLFRASDGTMLFNSKADLDLGPVSGLCFHPDGHLLVSAHPHAGVRLWSVPEGRPLGAVSSGEKAQAVVFSPDGRLLAVGCSLETNGRSAIQLWNFVPEKNQWSQSPEVNSPISRLFFAGSDRLGFVAASSDLGLFELHRADQGLKK